MHRVVFIFSALMLTAGVVAANASATTKKASEKPVRREVLSLLTTIAKQSRQPGYHGKGDKYLAIDIGSMRYISRIKDGRFVKVTKAPFPVGGMADGWADVAVNLLDRRMKETSQGGGHIYKQKGKTWLLVSISENGGYSRQALVKAGMPQSVMRRLRLEFDE